MATTPQLAPTITDRVKRILTLAEETSRARGSAIAGGEILLLAMLEDGGGVACTVLDRLGVEVKSRILCKSDGSSWFVHVRRRSPPTPTASHRDIADRPRSRWLRWRPR